jgi:hypothetical protein
MFHSALNYGPDIPLIKGNELCANFCALNDESSRSKINVVPQNSSIINSEQGNLLLARRPSP